MLKDTPIDIKDTLDLKSITKNAVKALGSVIFKVMDKVTKFYIVKNDFNISSDGILGVTFLKNNNAIIDYSKGNLIFGDTQVPFYRENRVKIPSRSIVTMFFNIMNPEKAEGYVPLLEPTIGLFMGQALIPERRA